MSYYDDVLSDTPRLPVELLVTIAELLAGDGCLDTIARLNIACRRVHEETLSVLYETLSMQYSQVAAEESPVGSASGLPIGWAYVR
jgi:hypothetical protein